LKAEATSTTNQCRRSRTLIATSRSRWEIVGLAEIEAEVIARADLVPEAVVVGLAVEAAVGGMDAGHAAVVAAADLAVAAGDDTNRQS
jgi:hypothetical protein